ncbi:dTDP-4-dehydrorhamnose 3,5-epimerase family protein [Sphingobium bisphenolivorans]|uniref:dTDP-4-dehydrorhamnose 3,5-epimerase family protein n=1 Tax=Sphingobium bisphenolivorans TaxID=1335760 RepID=UPI00187CE1B8|nr:dTDP-4-dehydrorhamnose 3,5-epimerase family protein [Sphingobium bisphenolivorans]
MPFEIEELAAEAYLAKGHIFSDERGISYTSYEAKENLDSRSTFDLVEESIIKTKLSGCFRGLHYQLEPHAQAKIVNVTQGSAQFFWVDLQDDSPIAQVNSIILSSPHVSLYTPRTCAHGFLALEDDTVFVLKVDRSLNFCSRAEVSAFADDIDIVFHVPPSRDLLSKRDQYAPSFKTRRR